MLICRSSDSRLWCHDASYWACLEHVYPLVCKCISCGNTETARLLHEIGIVHWESQYWWLSIDPSTIRKDLCISMATLRPSSALGESLECQSLCFKSWSPSQLSQLESHTGFGDSKNYDSGNSTKYKETVRRPDIPRDNKERRKAASVEYTLSCLSFETYSLFIPTIWSLSPFHINPFASFILILQTSSLKSPFYSIFLIYSQSIFYLIRNYQLFNNQKRKTCISKPHSPSS